MLDPVIANIIYFPNKRMKFQPSLEDIPLSFNQIEEVRSQAVYASRLFEGNKELVTKHIYNKLRIVFCVQRVEDIPRQHFNEALNLIEQAERELSNFQYFIKELQKKFAEMILRNGDPWTASTRSSWCKQVAQEFPERPDWQSLAAEITTLKFKR